jgi:hypothetical protein
MAAQPEVQIGNLGVATEEIRASFLAEAFQTEPRMLEVDEMEGSRRASVLQNSIRNLWIGDGYC